MRLTLAAAALVAIASLSAQAQHSLDGPVCPERSVPFHAFCQWQLRPNSSQWLSLLAPAGQTVLGTPAADDLAAGGEGDVVDGLAGNDSLASLFNRTALIGGRGNDDLSTEASTVGDPVRGIAAQLGGSGNDVHRASLILTGVETASELLIDLGPGDDQVEGTVTIDSSSGEDEPDNAVSNQIFGRDGDDTINAVADAQNFFGDSLALNAVDGGNNEDHITVRAISEFSGSGTITDNRVAAGDGEDVVNATAINWANDPLFASNLLLGQRGDDTLSATMVTDSNSSFSPGVNALWGGDGDDELDAVHETDGENFVTELTTLLDGGKGADQLRAESRAWGESVITLHELDGGPGNDTLTLLLDLRLFSGDDGNESTIVLEGGPGVDHLEASVTADEFDDPCDEDEESCNRDPRAQNHLSGGRKDDVLVASLSPEVIGASFLNGGSGDDELTVSGGSGNELDGGDDKDALFAGSGDDRLRGGASHDTFHFDLSEDQGSDTLEDFSSRLDVLSFAGISDAGAPGLADDLDAISTFLDLGPANDVVIDLASGSQIIFAGRGTGEVDSWADLLPPQAEAKHAKKPKKAKKKAVSQSAAALASRAAAVPELALLPRDH